MASAIVTEIQETDPSLSKSGTWTTVTGGQYSGGSAVQSSTIGNTATLSFSGRAGYLLTQTFHHGMPTGGAFTYTVDGQSYGQVECQNDSTQAPFAYPRVLVPLARGLTDGAHTLVMTVSVAGPVTVDSFLVVSGSKQTPQPGLLVSLGDSWTKGSGAQDTGLAAYPNRLSSLLQAKLGRPVTLVRKGAGGDALHCIDGAANGDSTRSGGMHRAYLDILQASALTANGGYPEFVTYLFGVNDLRSSLLGALDAGGQNVSPGTFGRHLCGVLCFPGGHLAGDGGRWPADEGGSRHTPVRLAVVPRGPSAGQRREHVPAGSRRLRAGGGGDAVRGGAVPLVPAGAGVRGARRP